MASESKRNMVEGAVRLLAQRGLQATSFSEVLELTKAPRGSIYHHFPEGKDQLVSAAIDLAGARALEFLDSRVGASAEDITRGFIALWRELLTRSNFGAGCAVLAVTVATDSGPLLDQAAEVFRSWRDRLAELLAQGGLEKGAKSFATLLVTACEGAVVLSRAERSPEPLDLAAEELLERVRALVRS